MSAALQSRFRDYADFHRTPGNQACHAAGIPLIVFAIVALLTRLTLADIGGTRITLAEVAVVVVTLWYLRLDSRLALLMLAVLAISAVVGRFIPALVAWGLFAAGWALQFVGHYAYEKKSPAFFGNLAHLLVGPLWILAKATGRA